MSTTLASSPTRIIHPNQPQPVVRPNPSLAREPLPHFAARLLSAGIPATTMPVGDYPSNSIAGLVPTTPFALTVLCGMIGVLIERHPDLLATVLYGSVARHKEGSLDDPDTSAVDLLVIFDTDDESVRSRYGAAFAHSCGIAFTRHLDAPREVQALIASRHLREWDPACVANLLRDGHILFARSPLPEPMVALPHG